MIVTMKDRNMWSVERICIDEAPAATVADTLADTIGSVARFNEKIENVDIKLISDDSPQRIAETIYSLFLKITRLANIGERYSAHVDLTKGISCDLPSAGEVGECIYELADTIREKLGQVQDLARIIEEYPEIKKDEKKKKAV